MFIFGRTVPSVMSENAATTFGSFSTYYVFNKILFDYLKAYHQISPKPEMEQAQVLLNSDSSTCGLQGLTLKMPEKPQSRRILDKESGPIFGDPAQTLTHLFKICNTEEFQWTQKDFITYMTGAMYCAEMELIVSMLCFYSHFCHIFVSLL